MFFFLFFFWLSCEDVKNNGTYRVSNTTVKSRGAKRYGLFERRFGVHGILVEVRRSACLFPPNFPLSPAVFF